MWCVCTAAVLEAAKQGRGRAEAEAAAEEQARVEAEAEAEAKEEELLSVAVQDLSVPTRSRADSMTSMMGDF